jgi:hypothetical protein
LGRLQVVFGLGKNVHYVCSGVNLLGLSQANSRPKC